MSVLEINKLRSFCLERFNNKNLGVIHGVSHWDRVAKNGERLYIPGADADVIAAFAYLHDVERINNYVDIEHGERAARLIDNIKDKYLKGFSDLQIEKLQTACRLHNKTRKTGDITIDICFDSDRLDLDRVGVKLDPLKMATEMGRKCVLDGITNSSGKRFIFALFDTAAKYNANIISDSELIKGAFYKYGTYGDNRFTMIEATKKYTFTKEALGALLRVAFTFGSAPKTQLEQESMLFSKVPKCYIMTPKEIDYYNNLPQKITIYRGTSKNELQSGNLSPSWTEDLDRAITYALHGEGNENDKSDRIVIKTEIAKQDIKAVFFQGFAMYVVIEIVYYHHKDNKIEIVYETKRHDPNNRYLSYKKRMLYTYVESLKAAEILAKMDGIWPQK